MKVRTIFLVILCTAILTAVPFLSYQSGPIEASKNSVTILTLVQVDEFEGGSGSRTSFLQRRSEEFTKKNKNVFIECRQATESELITILESGNLPDMISFSAGVGENVFPYLSRYGGSVNVRGDLASCGISGGKIYALPWCMGGYALVKKAGKKTDTAFLGASAYSNPYPALKKSGLKGGELKSQYDAFTSFISQSEHAYLLGTQRDIVRCEMKISQGKLQNVEVTAISGYTDLVQCVGISAKEERKKPLCEKFMEFLTGDSVQAKLSQIFMLPVSGASIYTEGGMKVLEEGLRGELSTVNVFTPKAELANMRRDGGAKGAK